MKHMSMRALTLLACLFAFNASVGDTADCITCHKGVVSSWQKSDHAKAMSVATDKTVLADFDNREFSHFTQKAKFYRENELFRVELTDNNETKNYTIDYTFGHYPLQQYLVRADNGRFQVFPFAWDSRVLAQGGQRWFANYDQEDIHPNDRLHWQQPLQNWNGMCADCHSDGFKRNYKIENDTFSSDWDNINVSCKSCHGKMAVHSKVSEDNAAAGWRFEFGSAIASWQGESRDNQFMDTCFSCHSLRAPLTDGFDSSTFFLDQFSPTFLTPDMYHADGQIKEEVYVYGSFLQSKMFAAGVNCLDCHDPHTMQVKSQSNGLCLQCHLPAEYQSEKHTFHPLESDGGQCVNCHMPETRFMGVDDRRDHSFVVPKPHLSEQYATPNACTACHNDKGDEWAAESIKRWYGVREKTDPGEQLYLDLQRNRKLPVDQHFSLIHDQGVSVIKRATAILMLPMSTQSMSDEQISGLVKSAEPLVRLAVARIGFLLSEEERAMSYSSLLQDRFKSIRVAAANQLVGVGLEATIGFKRGFDELTIANETTSWRAEGSLNRSQVYIKHGDTEKSIKALQHALTVDPYFADTYINLADIYRQLGQSENEVKTYQAGLKAIPQSAMLHYAKGLSLVRAGDKSLSIQSFKRAVELDEYNPRFAYLYFMALDSQGLTKKALLELRQAIVRYRSSQQLGRLGLSLAKKLKEEKEYEFYRQYLDAQ